MKKGYYIEEVLGKKKFLKSQDVISYRLCIEGEGDGYILAMDSSVEKFDEVIENFDKVIENYEKWLESPLYRVFKLGSGEYQIFKKYNFSRYDDDDSYSAVDMKYFNNLDDACKELLKYERESARLIREPVDCV